MRDTRDTIRRWVGGALLVFCVTLASSARAEQLGTHEREEQFCAGFSKGWISVKGTTSNVPFCPIVPSIPTNSTYYGEGFKAGAKAARKR